MLLIILPVKIEIWGVYPVYPIFIYSKQFENNLEKCFQDALWLFNIAMEHGTLFIDDQKKYIYIKLMIYLLLLF